MTRPRLTAPLLVAAALAAGSAHGGGLGRPNQIGARALGLGGAFTAVADDPSAIYHNPSGLAFHDQTQILLDVQLILLARGWVRPDGTNVPETTPPQFAPTIGASTRFAFGKDKDKPSRLALGVAFYPSFGGAIQFNPATIKDSLGPSSDGISQTQILLLEIAPAVAYQVSDVLALGLSLRIGIGLFSVTDKEAAFAAELSAVAPGIGASLSAMVRPHPRIQIGVIYRTPLNTNMAGSSPVCIGTCVLPLSGPQTGGTTANKDFNLNITWPQSAALGVQLRAMSRLRFVAQADWTGWSSIQSLTLDFHSSLTQVKPIHYSDSFTFHVGAEADVLPRRLQLRLGAALDLSALDGTTARRENRDGLKGDVTGGASLLLGRFRIDAAVDLLLAEKKTIVGPAPSSTSPIEPGTYSATVVTLGLSGLARF